MNLCDPRTIRDVMSMYGMTFRKELGQNFLTNAAVVEDIADACSDTRDATILEIGPGIGVLTQELGMRYRRGVGGGAGSPAVIGGVCPSRSTGGWFRFSASHCRTARPESSKYSIRTL